MVELNRMSERELASMPQHIKIRRSADGGQPVFGRFSVDRREMLFMSDRRETRIIDIDLCFAVVNPGHEFEFMLAIKEEMTNEEFDALYDQGVIHAVC